MCANHYDQTWLNRTDLDPWLIRTDDPLSIDHRDAFIGNGLLGQRISPWGDGSAYERSSQSFMYGMWDRDDRNNEAIAELPTWAVLDFRHPGPMGRVSERILNHQQTLDLRTATVETRYRVEGSHWSGEVKRRAWISRTETNLAVLELEIVPERGWFIQVTERFDATWKEQVSGVETSLADGLQMQLSLGPDAYPLALTSHLESGDLKPDWTDEEQRDDFVERSSWFAIRPGEPIKVTRLIAINPSAQPDDTLAGVSLPDLRNRHEKAWAELWQSWIEVPHPALQQLLNASLYHLYAQSRENTQLPVGPCGISGDGYQGRVFWDADMWVLPPLALLHPKLAKGMIEYRFQTLDGAYENAREDGYDGACFPWESAATGKEWVPFPVIHEQRHVNSDVAYAQWLYTLISGDTTYMREKGAKVIIESARYWASRVVFNEAADRYELRGIYCADEFAGIQDNNASTNYGAAWTLRKAAQLAQENGLEEPVERWLTIADKMFIPWHEEDGVIAEYEGWRGDRTIKQADTTLLVYPWQMPMEEELKSRIVSYYRARYPENKIMMGSAIDGIVDCELGHAESGWTSLIDLLPHLHPPYYSASESPKNDRINFITGHGGMLQLVLMGFAGIRVQEDGLEHATNLPEELPWLRVHGVHFGGVRRELFIERS